MFIAESTRRLLQSQVGQPISLHTIYYHDGDPSRGRVTPRLVGFLSEVEREFFEMFCSVDGVGAKKALRAMVRPVQDIAEMIEEQDAKGLSSLPGVGGATADRIIAKLRRKMSKFALLVAQQDRYAAEVKRDVVQEASRPCARSATPMPTPASCSTACSRPNASSATSRPCCRPSISRATAGHDA